MNHGPATGGFQLVTVAFFASGLVFLTGLLVMTGWWLNVETLKRVMPGMVAMHALGGFCFVLAATSLALQIRPRKRVARHAAAFLALVVMCIGIMKLVCFRMDWSFPPDLWFYPDALERPGRGRMALNTSLCFALTGGALLFLDRKSRLGVNFSELLLGAASLTSLLAVVGHVYGVIWLSGMVSHIPMALHSAISFIVLCVGIAFARPARGAMSVITADSAGGMMARRIFPAMVLVFIGVGAMRIFGERYGYYGSELGGTLYAVTSIAILGVIVLWCAKSLHQAEIARRAIQEEHNRFFRLSVDILCIAGMDGYFKRINPAFSKILGFTEEELMNRQFEERIHPDDLDATRQELARLATGESTFRFENRYRCKDGSWKWLEWNTRPFLQENVLYAVARDVTEKKESELAILSLNAELIQQKALLENVNEELESFSYSVSHDLRAPLRAISGFTQAIAEHSSEVLDETGNGYLERVRNAAERMGRLIDNLLKLSRLTRTEMNLLPVDLSRLAEAAVAEFRAADPLREVEVTIDPGIRAMGDPSLLAVVIENLLGNAWKFTSKTPGAKIRVSGSDEPDGRISCRIRDNGTGFDMRYANKLFGAFQRLHSQIEFPGIGIGLATVQRIVRRHGGEVFAESEINHGATFGFTLEAVSERSLP